MIAVGFFYAENLLMPLENQLKSTHSIFLEIEKEISLLFPQTENHFSKL